MSGAVNTTPDPLAIPTRALTPAARGASKFLGAAGEQAISVNKGSGLTAIFMGVGNANPRPYVLIS
jgi:hypothetical protein